MKRRRALVKGLGYLFLIISSFIVVYPVLYLALGAFTTTERFLDTILFPIPNTLNLDFIIDVLNWSVWDAYIFTLIRCAFYVTLSVIVGLLGGYVFSKLRFPGRNKVFLLLLMGMVMPAILMILPMYIMMARLPLVGGNNLFGQGGHGLIYDWRVLFVYGWVPPFAIFLLKQSFDMLPTEYEDAAKMDGAGFWTIIFRVYGPLLKPPIAALIVVTFLVMWNDYLWPSVAMTQSAKYVPITMRVQGFDISDFSSGFVIQYPLALMLILMALWPPALVYFIFQRYFIQGLVASGVKG